jgi:hypothetical protein
MHETIKRQIFKIRATGKTNMFDVVCVQRLAYERGYYELVLFIKEQKNAYARFILTGEE